MSRMKYLAASAALLAIIAILIPIPMIVARRCTIIVLDEEGKPWANAKVNRGWAYGSEEISEEGVTGSNGTVTFAPRLQGHSLLARCLVPIEDVLVVHGSVHISDEYIITFPTNYTAEIDGDAGFKWVYDEGHLAKVDFQNVPRDQTCSAKFTLKRKNP